MISPFTYNKSMIEKNEVVMIGGYLIDPEKYPWLTDHIFHNVSVLPGSFLIDLAFGISRELYFRFPGSIRNLKFLNPLILKSDGINLNVSVNRLSTFERKILFSESDSDTSKTKNISAEAELILQNINFNERNLNFIPSEFIKTSAEIDTESFYFKLNESGNQYGQGFRNLKKIWLKDNSAVAQLKNLNNHTEKNFNPIHPALLDSAIQLLALFSDNNPGAFVLDSIKEVQLLKNELQTDLWGYAEIKSNGNKSFIEGEVGIFNSSGELCIRLSGVKIKYPEQQIKNSEVKKNIIVSANFTIDPMEDSLKFWNKYFNSPFSFEFAPYNQIFQELLSSSSQFYKNNHGINVILLNPEEWLSNEQMVLQPIVTGEAYSSLLKNKDVYSLPDKTDIVHINRYETDYLYNEIFRDKCYQRYGISIKNGDTIIDIGANIGLFTLYVNSQGPDSRVFSFEPSPVFELLKTNAELYCKYTKVFNKGVSDRKGKAQFTFYPNSTVFSGFAANKNEDAEAIRHVIENILRDESGADESVINNYVNEITGERLKKENYECEIVTVSDIIRENNLDEINLLKIDAEKSEIEILEGIEEKDWPRIHQIVIEIHDSTGLRLQKAKDILTKRGFNFCIDEETKLRKTGLFNLYASRFDLDLNYKDNKTRKLNFNSFKRNNEQFSKSLLSFAFKKSSSVILGVVPCSPDLLSDKKTSKIIKDSEQILLNKLKEAGNISTISSDEFLNAFNIPDYYDNSGQDLGQLIYSSEMYASIGTLIFRKSISLINSRCKVIVLDCDNTLWKGLCVEDGYDKIQITENFKFLQSFILDQFNSGKLICLCSKNNEEDIDNVFEKRKDMILKKENIISKRINWESKSENIKSLISEFDLSPDSFVLIDDNPLECAEVRSNCPGVAVFTLPENENDIPVFLKNIWLFDIGSITEEDKKRTGYYRENILRNRYQETAPSLKEFIKSLNLKISVTEADETRLNRAAQLTFRTNQFNFTTIRRNEQELRTLLNSGNYHCLLSEVSDRFGDYGTTGVLIYSFTDRKIKVDTFLLSCRVLGKGVEHKILSELGKIGQKNYINEIEITFIPSSKNRPAHDFINTLIPDIKKEDNEKIIFTFSPDYLSKIEYEPEDSNENNQMVKNQIENPVLRNEHPFNDYFGTIAGELSDINLLMKKILDFSFNSNKREVKKIIPPQSNIEIQLCDIWQRVLGINDISIDDNFFDCGGTSLKAIQLISEIKKEINKEISIIDLFEYPTINKLGEKIKSQDKPGRADLSEESPDSRSKRRRAFLKRKRIG